MSQTPILSNQLLKDNSGRSAVCQKSAENIKNILDFESNKQLNRFNQRHMNTRNGALWIAIACLIAMGAFEY